MAWLLYTLGQGSLKAHYVLERLLLENPQFAFLCRIWCWVNVKGLPGFSEALSVAEQTFSAMYLE